MDINVGIPNEKREKIAEGLSRLLADSYSTYLKTHNYHWNVTGPMFRSLHLMFEEQYTELAEAVDEIAERIRALGEPAPGSYQDFARLGSIEEDPVGEVPEDKKMVANLVLAHEQIVRTAREAFKPAEKADDETTMDLLVERMRVSEKTAWMLRSILED